jgi:hypothetical protein
MHGGHSVGGIAYLHYKYGGWSKYVPHPPPSAADLIAAMQVQGLRVEEIAARLGRCR